MNVSRGSHSARLVLASVDFAEVEHMQASGEWGRAGQLLVGVAKSLRLPGRLSGALYEHDAQSRRPYRSGSLAADPHWGDTTAAAVEKAGFRTVGLLGTAFTMEQDFYRDRLARHGLSVVVPSPVERAEVHRVIYEELCLEGAAQLQAGLPEIIAGLVAAGAQGVILGCTEIELLVRQEDSTVPLFPTTRLHVDAAR